MFLQINSTPSFSMYYDIHGTGPIKICFVMGLGVSHRGWENQFKHFGNKEEYSCLVFDNRGCGKTDVVSWRTTTSAMALDTAELLEFLGWTSDVHLVGVSMGGMISLELSLLRPENFSSLILTSTHAGRTLAPAAGVTGIMRSLITPKAAGPILSEVLFPRKYLDEPAPTDFVPRYLKKALSEGNIYTKQDMFMENLLKRRKEYPITTLKGFTAQLAAVMTHHISRERLEILRDSKINILVVTGDEDNLVRPSNSHYLASMLEAELRVFVGGGHTVLHQHEEEYNELVDSFIKTSIEKSMFKSLSKLYL